MKKYTPECSSEWLKIKGKAFRKEHLNVQIIQDSKTKFIELEII